MLNPAFLFHNSIVHDNVFLRHAYKTGSAVKLPNGRFNNFECQTATSHADTSCRQTTKVSANIPARSAVTLLLYLIRNCKTEQPVWHSLETAPALLIINQKTRWEMTNEYTRKWEDNITTNIKETGCIVFLCSTDRASRYNSL